jgi:hypothetical protein
MRRVILSSMACPVLKYLSSLYHNRHDFIKQVIEREIF